MKSLEELRAIREKMQGALQPRENADNQIRVVVGMATCGIAAGARPVLSAISEEIATRKLNNVQITQTGCIGVCQHEPVVEIYTPDGNKTTYVNMTPEKARVVVNDHIVNGNIVQGYVIGTVSK